MDYDTRKPDEFKCSQCGATLTLVDGVLKPCEHSVKAVGFDPKELVAGDRFDVSGHVLAVYMDADEEGVNAHNNLDSSPTWDVVLPGTWTIVVCAKGSDESCRRAVRLDRLFGRITRVVRGGVRIYPRPEPKFKVGDSFRRIGYTSVYVVEEYARQGDDGSHGKSDKDYVVYNNGQGFDFARDLELAPAPAWVPKVGEIVLYHGTLFTIRDSDEVELNVLDGRKALSHDKVVLSDLKPYIAPVDDVNRIASPCVPAQVRIIGNVGMAICELTQEPPKP